MVVGELIGSEGCGEDIGERCDGFFDRRERKRTRNVKEKGVWRSVTVSYRYLLCLCVFSVWVKDAGGPNASFWACGPNCFKKIDFLLSFFF